MNLTDKFGDIINLTTVFINLTDDETVLKAAIGYLIDCWTAVNGGNTWEILYDTALVAKGVNDCMGKMTKEDVYGSTHNAS